jgi:hypothetical protein
MLRYLHLLPARAGTYLTLQKQAGQRHKETAQFLKKEFFLDEGRADLV